MPKVCHLCTVLMTFGCFLFIAGIMFVAYGEDAEPKYGTLPYAQSFIVNQMQETQKFYATHAEFKQVETDLEKAIKEAATAVNLTYKEPRSDDRIKFIMMTDAALADLKYSNVEYKRNLEFKVSFNDAIWGKLLDSNDFMVGLVETKYYGVTGQIGFGYTVVFEKKKEPVIFVKIKN